MGIRIKSRTSENVKGEKNKFINQIGKNNKNNMRTKIIFLITKLSLLVLILWLLFGVCFAVFQNGDEGMKPTIRQGDLIVSYRLDKAYAFHDLVAFESDGEKQVSRVVAVEGDTVDIDEEGLKVNGTYIQETDITEKTERYTEGITFPITLKKGEIFLLGDAREHATDSRIYGAVNKKDTLGKVVTLVRRNRW